MSLYNCFSSEFAIEYGVEEAVLINHLIGFFNSESQMVCLINGEKWIGPFDKFFSFFPYWSEIKVCDILQHLVDEGFLKHINNDFSSFYAFVEDQK